MGLLALLSACTKSDSLEYYKDVEPKLDLQTYFTGQIKAWGLVQDYRGRVTRRFDVDMVGSWDGDTGTLHETFKYYDGEDQMRVWTIKRTAENRYEGRADDILDKATGESSGNAIRWGYKMDLEVDGKTYRISFDDWMFLMNDGVLVNRSYLKKFGLTVGELTLFMQKQTRESV